MIRVECPQCHTSYPADRLVHDPPFTPVHGREYTVLCLACQHQFDVQFRQGQRLFGILGGGLKAVVRPRS